MKLWKLKIDNKYAEYDDYRGFVIRATDEYKARVIAASQTTDFGKYWLDSLTSTCTEIKIEGEEEVILSDFWDA